MNLVKTEYSELAVEFANALVVGKFDDAYQLLADTIKAQWSPALLQETYQEMVSYFIVPPTRVTVEYVMTEWQLPVKQATDIGWAYVSICGDSDGEGIAVIICKEQGRCAIRYIEWGRP